MNQFQKLETFDVLQNELNRNLQENDHKIKVLKNDIEIKQSRFELENENSLTRKALDHVKEIIDAKTNEIIAQIKMEQSSAVNPVNLNGDLAQKKGPPPQMQVPQMIVANKGTSFMKSQFNSLPKKCRKRLDVNASEVASDNKSAFIKMNDRMKIELIKCMNFGEDEQTNE